MKRFFLTLLLIAAASAAALEVPPQPTQWVTDRAGLLGGTEADLLNAKLRDFEQASGAQFIVYTFPSLEGEAIEDFTIRCVERWKVGQKKYDNGLVLFVFKQERLVRVEVGYGLEGTITDAISSRAIREYAAPHFRQNDYAGGLNAAVDFLVSVIRKGEAPVPPLQPRNSGGGQQQPAADISPVTILIILVVVFFIILPMVRRSSGCGGCIIPIFPGGGTTFGGGGFGSGGGFSGGGFGGGGGFSGGGGSFGGGGATGSW